MTTAVAVAGERRLMAQVERWVGAHIIGIAMLGVVVIAALIAAPFVLPRIGTPTDWFDISAILAIVAGFAMAMSVPWRSQRVLTQLADRRVLQLSGEQFDRVQRDLRSRAARAARWGMLIGGIVILFPIALFAPPGVVVLLDHVRTNDAFGVALNIGELAISVPATLLVGLLGGYYLGYVISVGGWAVQLRAHGVTLRARPGHPDGAAGWGPLGDLYLFQALMPTIAALYYGVWSYLIAAHNSYAYVNFRLLQTPYFVFFLISLAGEVLAFVAPVWSFHTDMRRQKLALASETDALSDRILSVQARAIETDDPEQAYRLSQQLATMTSLYTARVEMPTWPFNTGVTVRFGLANLGLLLPLVAQLAQVHLPF
jgi:hypothetical protein